MTIFATIEEPEQHLTEMSEPLIASTMTDDDVTGWMRVIPLFSRVSIVPASREAFLRALRLAILRRLWAMFRDCNPTCETHGPPRAVIEAELTRRGFELD